MSTETSTPALFDLSGKVIIVTGGAVGIGKVYCRHLRGAGARVVVADIKTNEAQALARELAGNSDDALAVTVDVEQEDQTLAMAEAAIEAYGRIDGLVNNAALFTPLPRRPWHEVPLDEWDQVMAVNVRGSYLCCRAVYPQMKKQGKGKIVNISSSTFHSGTGGFPHYVTSKGAVVGLTRALAHELGAENININAISPGMTLSETYKQVLTEEMKASRLERQQKNASIKRLEVPEDLVGTMMYLLSDASDFLSGQTINVDGGLNFG